MFLSPAGFNFFQTGQSKVFFRGVEWADSLLENRSLAVLCSALRFKLKVKNLFTKSALKIAVYSSLEFTVVESWNPKVIFVLFLLELVFTAFYCETPCV